MFQPPIKISYQRALTCALTNQLATPGLGSLMGGRLLAGGGQLLLSLSGFGLFVIWFALTLRESYRMIYSDETPTSYIWVGLAGALIFAAAWIWALVTSISLLRQSKVDDQAEQAAAPPRITSPPAK
jgi:hypothetical protein